MTQRQIIETPLTGGMSQRTAGPHVPLGEFTAIQNLRQNKNGSLSKRPGNTRLTNRFQLPNNAGPANIDASLGGALSAYGNQLLLTTNGGKCVYEASYGTFGVPQAASEALLMRVNTTVTPDVLAGSTSRFKMQPAIVTDGTHLIYCWVSNQGTVFVTIEEIATGAILVDQATPSIGSGVVVAWAVPIITNGQLVIVWQSTSATHLLQIVTLASPFTGTFTAPVTIASNIATALFCPHDVVANGANFTVAYATSTPQTVLATFTTLGVQVGSGVIYATSASLDVRIDFSFGDDLWIARALSSSGIDFRLHSASTLLGVSALTTVTGTTVYSMSVKATAAGFCAIAYTQLTGTDGTNYTTTCAALCKVVGSTGSVAINGISNQTANCYLASKPFVQGSKIYFWVHAFTGDGAQGGTSGTQGTISSEFGALNSVQWTGVLVDSRLDVGVSNVIVPLRPVGVDAPRFTYPVMNHNINGGAAYSPLSVVSLGSSKWLIVSGIRQTAYISNWAKITADFASPIRWKSTQLGTLLLESSGMVVNYDGAKTFENGFLQHAQLSTLSITAGAGGVLTASATYFYRVVPVYLDGAGNAHRGIPSPLVQVSTSASNKSFLINIPTVCLTDRSSPAASTGLIRYPIFFEIYRSQPNPGSTGGDVATNLIAIVDDLLTSSAVGFNDISVPDTVAAANAECYTFGGDLPNGCPPGGLDIEACGGRAWLLSDDGNNCYFSKAIVDGEAVNFTDGFTQPLDVNDGVALKALDEKIIALTKTRLYFQAGVGPEDNGQQSDFQGFQRIQSSVGCNDRRSVVSTPDGVMFLSSIGFYLLDRALEVIYIGQPVTDEVLKFPICVASVLHASQPWVYFYMTNAAGNAGERLIYDYRLQKWYTDTLPGVPVSAVNLENGTHYWLDSNGQVWQEDATGTIGTDDGLYVNSLWTAGSMGGASIFAWMRAYRMQLLYQRNSRCDIILTTTNDYSSTLGMQQQVFWDREFESFPDAVQMIEIKHKRTNTTAVEITVQDQAPANTSGGSSSTTAPDNGLGVTYFGVGFEIESKPGFFQLPSAQAKG